MKIRPFFKLPGYIQFEYRPRYYDEEKERKELRKKQMAMKRRVFEKNPNIEGEIKNERKTADEKVSRYTRLIRIAIVALLILIAYYLAKMIGLLIPPE